MQKQTEETNHPRQTTLVQDLTALMRYGLMGHRGLFIIGGGFAISGLYLGWDWLVAAGLAPIILTLAPCAVMCGFGLCMTSRKGEKSCSSTPDDASDSGENPPIKSLVDANKAQQGRESKRR